MQEEEEVVAAADLLLLETNIDDIFIMNTFKDF